MTGIGYRVDTKVQDTGVLGTVEYYKESRDKGWGTSEVDVRSQNPCRRVGVGGSQRDRWMIQVCDRTVPLGRCWSRSVGDL